MFGPVTSSMTSSLGVERLLTQGNASLDLTHHRETNPMFGPAVILRNHLFMSIKHGLTTNLVFSVKAVDPQFGASS